MAKPSYETHVEPRLNTVTKWAREGVIDKDIASRLGIGYCTLRDYKKKYPALQAALSMGKEEADAMVESALFKRALGFEYEEVKTIIEQTTGGKEHKKVEKTKKLVLPSMTAQIFWLKNRLKTQFKDNPKDEAEKNDIAEAVKAAIESLSALIQNPVPVRTLEELEAEDLEDAESDD